MWPIVDLLRRNPIWLSIMISSAYGVNFDSRMLDKILYVVDKFMSPELLHSVLSPSLEIGTMIVSFLS
jgi:hypothetical protein